MRLHHVVFLVLIALGLMFPKLIAWIAIAMVVAALLMVAVSGPVSIANLFAPRAKKR